MKVVAGIRSDAYWNPFSLSLSVFFVNEAMLTDVDKSSLTWDPPSANI